MTDRSKHPDVIARVRELDQALDRRGIASETSERVRGALQERALERRFAARLRWWPILAFAAGALVMAAALFLIGERERSSEPPELVEAPTPIEQPRPDQAPAPDHATRECAIARPGDAELAAGECAANDGVRITALLDSRYSWSRDRVSLDAGELSFEVESRPDHPLEVIVGEGVIEVIGTSFIVHRDPGIGWISLLEGHVRVRVNAGEATELHAGEQLEWSPPTPELAPAREPAPPSRGDDDGLSELLEEVAALRREGEYEAAVARLRAGERPGWSARSRQLVSYEIGTLLERQLRDFDAACEHWARHRERFVGGRHAAIIAASMDRMGCDSRD